MSIKSLFAWRSIKSLKFAWPPVCVLLWLLFMPGCANPGANQGPQGHPDDQALLRWKVFHSLPALEGKTVVVMPKQQQDVGAEMEHYLGLLRTELAARGISTAQAVEAADYFVALTVLAPTHKDLGASFDYRTIKNYAVRIEFYDAESYRLKQARQVYDGSANSVSTRGDATKLTQVLIRQLVSDLPGTSGEAKERWVNLEP